LAISAVSYQAAVDAPWSYSRLTVTGYLNVVESRVEEEMDAPKQHAQPSNQTIGFSP
jgi:hypothetical protein